MCRGPQGLHSVTEAFIGVYEFVPGLYAGIGFL